MSARRLGREIDQAALAATPHFKPKVTVRGGQTLLDGGFETKGLVAALDQVAQIPGRKWVGGDLPEDLSTPALLLKHLKGYLSATKASIILRVRGTKHWIIVDSVTSNDRFMIRDPGEPMPTIVTAEQLSAMHPIGEAVLSFPEKRK